MLKLETLLQLEIVLHQCEKAIYSELSEQKYYANTSNIDVSKADDG